MPLDLNLDAAFWQDQRDEHADYITEHVGLTPSSVMVDHILKLVVQAAIKQLPEAWAWLNRLLASEEVRGYLRQKSAELDGRWDWEWLNGAPRVKRLVEANDNIYELLTRFLGGYRDIRQLIEGDIKRAEQQQGRDLLAMLEAGGADAPFGWLDLSDQRPKEITPPEERIPVSGQAEAARLREMQKHLQQMQQERDEARREANDLAAQMAAMLPDDEPAPAAEIIDIQPIEESSEEEPEPDLDAAALMLGDDEEEEIQPPSFTNPIDTPQPRSLRTGKATGRGPWGAVVPGKKTPPKSRTR